MKLSLSCNHFGCVIFIVIMGACFTEKPIARYPTPTQQLPYQPSKISSIPQDNLNPQNLVPPKKETATAPSQTKITDSFISIQDALNDEFLDLPDCLPNMSVQTWEEQHNTRTKSVIIKKVNKVNKENKKKQSQSQKTRQTIQSVQRQQQMPAEFNSSLQFKISSKEFDIEFTLPRSRAGPLIVPHIDFSHYYLSLPSNNDQ